VMVMLVRDSRLRNEASLPTGAPIFASNHFDAKKQTMLTLTLVKGQKHGRDENI
jgi:hypothetical protein